MLATSTCEGLALAPPADAEVGLSIIPAGQLLGGRVPSRTERSMFACWSEILLVQ